MANSTVSAPKRDYITIFLKRRSIIALCCGILTLALAFYHIPEVLNPFLAIPILFLFGFSISSIIAFISNHLSQKRLNRMFSNWTFDKDPIEAKIEAYGLGEMIGKNSEKTDLRIPIDILEYLSEKYEMDLEDLVQPCIKGMLNGLSEHQMNR